MWLNKFSISCNLTFFKCNKCKCAGPGSTQCVYIISKIVFSWGWSLIPLSCALLPLHAVFSDTWSRWIRTPSGSLWTKCTARGRTGRPTRTCRRCSWAAWADRETSSRTTCSNCWPRSSEPSASWSTNKSVIDAADSSVILSDCRLLEKEEMWRFGREAADGFVWNNIRGVRCSVFKERKRSKTVELWLQDQSKAGSCLTALLH